MHNVELKRSTTEPMSERMSMSDGPLLHALREMVAVGRNYEVWSTLALSDAKLRYRRTTLGHLWITISTALTVLTVGLVYQQIFGHQTGAQRAVYLPFFAAGFVLWSFMSQTIADGCTTFIQNSGLIKSLPLSLLLHVYRLMAKSLVLLAHNLIIVVVLWLFFRWPIDWSLLLVLPALVVIVIFLFGLNLTLSIICTRFRDVQPIVTALLQLLFLLTPVIWPPSSVQGTSVALLLDLNPFYYLIEIARAPLLGQPSSWAIWGGALLISLTSLLIGAWLYGRIGHRVPYWL